MNLIIETNRLSHSDTRKVDHFDEINNLKTTEIPVLTFHFGKTTEQRSSLMQNKILSFNPHEV